ncbi:MAG: Uncharacterized protein FD188_2699, partial [Ignavibacteria bacterium]
MKSLLAIVMILFVFISTALPQGVDKRSRLLFQDRDYQSYGLSHFKKNNRIGEDKDIRRKFLSDIVLTEDDAFPERISKRLNLRSDRTEKETGINLHNELNKRGIKGDVAESNNAAWVKHYGSGLAPSSDVATNIAIDNLGNVYITGYSTKLPFGTDYYTVKYNASGDLVWSARYGGDQYIDNVATAISVDGSGNVYVTGRSYGSGTSHDYATIKYNSNGLVQWVQRYNGSGNSDDEAIALTVDGSGNVYVTGLSVGSGTSSDYATIKYNSNGIEQWVQRYNGPGNSYDEAIALTVDGSGNVYVTGLSYGSGTDDDYATIKYNSNGIEQWVQRYNGPGNSDDEAIALTVDGSGNVYVSGRSVGSGTSRDYATIKYNSNGIEQWVQRYNGPGNSFDEARAISVDGSGNIYVTGRSVGSGTFSDYATIKYNSNGIEQWVQRY